jgi:short subunit dehydrogenase-like uncharacterized protein
VVLAGRDRNRLDAVLAQTALAQTAPAGTVLAEGGGPATVLAAGPAKPGAAHPPGNPRLVAGTFRDVLAELAKAAPAAVINTIGPFPATAPEVIRACPPGTHYVDVANEFRAIRSVLEMDREAADTGRTLVPGGGFGVLATEAALLRACAGRAAPSRVRVDAIASVASEGGAVGVSLAASIMDVAATGAWRVRRGRLTRTVFGAGPVQLTTPAGDTVTTAGVSSGELIAAWRASGAPEVVATSALAPSGAAVRALLPAVTAVLSIPGAAGLAARRLARVQVKPAPRPRESSWAHAVAEWPSGDIREAWLRAGEGMDFTSAALAETALRLARGEGRPGAFTPGVLFGPSLAEAAGAEFVAGKE